MLKAKSNIYKAIVMNLLLWGYKNWNSNKTDTEGMERFHTKSIWKIMKIKMAQVVEEKLPIKKSEKASTMSTPLNK